MLLSHRYNFLFVHIAKTGGTSVRSALNKYKWHHPYGGLQFVASKISHATGHKIGCKFPRHSKIIAAQEMLPQELFEQLYKFAFVRNPWDLQVSSFHHIRRERPQFMNGISDFNEFTQWKLNPERPYQFHLDTSIELQSDYLVDLHGNLLTDFVGKYETLQADFDAVCERTGIKPFLLPHKREAKDRSKKYRDYYSDRTADMVAKHFKADIDRFGYTF